MREATPGTIQMAASAAEHNRAQVSCSAKGAAHMDTPGEMAAGWCTQTGFM